MFTGWDADGGYAEYAVVPEAFAYRLPDALDDVEAAPLLCAGIVGYRALRRAELPPGRPAGDLRVRRVGARRRAGGDRAGRDGARADPLRAGPGAGARARAPRRPGAADAAPPEPLDAAVLFAPAGELVPVALRALDQGGTLAVAGIHLTDVPALDYADGAVPGEAAAQRHREHPRRRRGVPAAGRRPARAAARSQPRPLAEADRALADLAADKITGAAVLVP